METPEVTQHVIVALRNLHFKEKKRRFWSVKEIRAEGRIGDHVTDDHVRRIIDDLLKADLARRRRMGPDDEWSYRATDFFVRLMESRA